MTIGSGLDLITLDRELYTLYTLTLGAIEIFPEQGRVTKTGVEIYMYYGESLSFYCMAGLTARVFSWEQLYNVAWGEDYELGTNFSKIFSSTFNQYKIY